AVKRERAAADSAAIADVADLKEGRCPVERGGSNVLLVEAREIAPHHHFDEPLRRQFGSRSGSDESSVAKHGHAVGKPGDLRHAMADIDNRQSVFAQAKD